MSTFTHLCLLYNKHYNCLWFENIVIILIRNNIEEEKLKYSGLGPREELSPSSTDLSIT